MDVFKFNDPLHLFRDLRCHLLVCRVPLYLSLEFPILRAKFLPYKIQPLKIMSRSVKKHPIIGVASHTASAMKAAKNKANRVIRYTDDEEIPNGNYYRRMNERWCFPDDGKHRYEDPKSYRK